MTRTKALLVYVATVAFLAVFMIYPILHVLKEAFISDERGFNIDFLWEVFANPIYVEGLRNSFVMAIFSTLLAFAIAMPLAWLSDRYIFPGKMLLTSAILVPLILPPFVGAIGIKHLMGPDGALNALLAAIGLADRADPIDWLGTSRMSGIVLLNALHLYPILYLNISAALANIDPAMEEAAANLGCPGWKKFVRITFPLAMPGIFAGGTVVFIWAFTELGVPLIFDYPRLVSMQIWEGLKDLGGNPFPYALVTVVLIFSTVLFMISKRYFGRNDYASAGRAGLAASAKYPDRPWQRWLCAFAFAAVTFVALLPHVGVILVSFSKDWYQTIIPSSFTWLNYQDALGDQRTVTSIANSLKYASLSSILDLVVGVAIAWIVCRTNLPGRQWLDSMAMLPLAVPGLVLAFGYLAMTREGRFFHFLVPDDNPLIILVIAYAVRRLPYIVRSAVAGFQQTSVTLEEAAMNLGCPPLRTFWRVTAPLITANLVAGGLLAFAFAMLEVSDSLILAQKQIHFPITKAIYDLFGALGSGEGMASALGVWSMIFLALTIIGASILLGKKLGALFRV
ncbi:MAG: ABC transporter permease [Verrucomicrobiales bacterium]